MNEDVLSGLPSGGLEDFVPDPALNALYAVAVATARRFNWPVPSREDFERKFKKEMSGKVPQ